MNVEMKKAEYLFDEIGLIDDRIIAEAMATKGVSVKRSIPVRKFVTAVAAAAVMVTVMLGTLVIGSLRGNEDGASSVGTSNQEAQAPNLTLSETLLMAEESEASSSYTSALDIDLFDGQKKIVWQSADGGEYYSLDIVGSSESTRLEKALERTYVRSENITSETTGVKLWICYGDGTVISPYIKAGNGNVGYGELFNYSPEIIPSDNFKELIEILIS